MTLIPVFAQVMKQESATLTLKEPVNTVSPVHTLGAGNMLTPQ